MLGPALAIQGKDQVIVQLTTHKHVIFEPTLLNEKASDGAREVLCNITVSLKVEFTIWKRQKCVIDGKGDRFKRPTATHEIGGENYAKIREPVSVVGVRELYETNWGA